MLVTCIIPPVGSVDPNAGFFAGHNDGLQAGLSIGGRYECLYIVLSRKLCLVPKIRNMNS